MPRPPQFQQPAGTASREKKPAKLTKEGNLRNRRVVHGFETVIDGEPYRVTLQLPGEGASAAKSRQALEKVCKKAAGSAKGLVRFACGAVVLHVESLSASQLIDVPASGSSQ